MPAINAAGMKKILTIEDELITQHLYSHILTNAFQGCNISQAFCGEDGIKAAIDEQPDVILLDIRLPDMDGYEICKTLKSDKRTRDIPIVMVSALGNDTKVRVRALNSGADSFITKPFDKTEFIGFVAVMLRIRNAEKILKQQNDELDRVIQIQTQDYSEKEDRYQKISIFNQHFFWEINAQQKISFVSDGAETLIGYPSKELLGQHISSFKLFPEMGKQESFRDTELKGMKKDGQVIWLAVSGFPIYNSEEIFDGFRGISHNISDRKEVQIDLEKSQKEINTYQNRLNSMNNALTRAEERERRKISEYLHDSLGATLALANMKLSTLAEDTLTPRVKRLIRETSDLLKNAISDSRTVIYELSPPMLYELGLVPTLRWKLEQVEKQGDLATKLDCETDFKGVDNEFLIFVYRIIAELLLNIMKHAHANMVVVKLGLNQNILTIDVKDNGDGMDTEILFTSEENSSYGLYSMRERVESLGGSMRITSEMGIYTQALIRLPVKI